MTQQKSTGTGLQENVAGLLCYVLGWVTGIVFLILEPKNKFIKFHAVQSIIVFGALFVVMMIFWWIPVIGWVIGIILWIAWFILWIWLMYQAYQGKKYMLPIAGVYADKIASGSSGTSNPPANPPSNPPANPPAAPAG